MTNYRHRVHGTHTAGDIWISGFVASSGQSLATVHSAFETWCNSVFGTTMKPLWPTDTLTAEIETDQLVDGGYKNTAQLVTGLAITGTGTGSPLSPSAAVVVGLRTNLPTRAGRGRMFIPAPTSASMASTGLLTQAVAASLSKAFGAAFAAYASTATPVVFHSGRKTATKPEVPATVTPVTAVTVGVVLGNQSRRVNKLPADYQRTAV